MSAPASRHALPGAPWRAGRRGADGVPMRSLGRGWTPLAGVQLVILVLVLVDILVPGVIPHGAAGGTFVVSVVLSARRLGRMQAFMIAMAVCATIAVLTAHTVGLAEIAVAADRGAFLASLLLALSFVRTAALHSALVRHCGEAIVSQPPGRRYLALLGGGQLFGIILNFGVVNLFGPMVMGAIARHSELERARRQRMMLAVVRGFSLVMLWCPTTVAQALILAAVPGLTWAAMLPYTLGSAVLAGALGFALDWVQRGPQPDAHGDVKAPSLRPLLTLCGVVGVFLVMIIATSQARGQAIVLAIVPVAPLFSALWMLIGGWPRHGTQAAALMVRRMARTAADFPQLANEIVLLGVAGYLGGIVASGLVVFAAGLVDAIVAMPPGVLAVGTMAAVAAVAQIGINPVIAVSIIGGALGAAPTLPVDPVLLGVALALGWCIAHGSSPFSAAALMTAKATALAPGVVGLRLNGLFSLCFLGLGAAILVALAAVMG